MQYFYSWGFQYRLTRKNSKTKKLTNIFENYGFSELIKSPTRKDPVSGKESALDHIWTNENKVSEFGKTEGISDHDGIFVKISLEREIPKTEKNTIRNLGTTMTAILPRILKIN